MQKSVLLTVQSQSTPLRQNCGEYSPSLVMKKLREIQDTLNTLVTTVNGMVHSNTQPSPSVEHVKLEQDLSKYNVSISIVKFDMILQV